MKNRRKKDYADLLLVGVILILIISSFTGHYLTLTKTSTTTLPSTPSPRLQQTSEVQLYLPAVDSEGNGVVTPLIVEAKPGRGRVLVDVNQLLFWVDTQHSIQVAKKVAEDVTGEDLSNIDLIYVIKTNASLIEGPSAGAAITIATIAALENKTINKSVMITGTINPDGTIGPVGGIIPKAKAAKDVGAKLFLVPKGQGTQTTYKPVRECEQIAGWTICQIEYREEKVNVMSQSGISIREVSNITEALRYFILR